VTRRRGELLPFPDMEPVRLVATIHPSAALRAEDREAVYAGLVDDLRVAAAAL
jgi:uracil-DNA glycosylase